MAAVRGVAKDPLWRASAALEIRENLSVPVLAALLPAIDDRLFAIRPRAKISFEISFFVGPMFA